MGLHAPIVSGLTETARDAEDLMSRLVTEINRSPGSSVQDVSGAISLREPACQKEGNPKMLQQLARAISVLRGDGDPGGADDD